jgi:hypothetical protein
MTPATEKNVACAITPIPLRDRNVTRVGLNASDASAPRQPPTCIPLSEGYVSGGDLGTTNCALAFVLLGSEARSEIFGIQQWDTSSTIMESPALPSFLYLPDTVTAAQIQPGTASGEVWVVGRLHGLDVISHLMAAKGAVLRSHSVMPAILGGGSWIAEFI